MATLLWNDVAVLTLPDAEQSILSMMDHVGFTGTQWQPFDLAPLYVKLTATIRVENSKIAVFVRDAFMAETASGEALTRTARGFFSLNRNLATNAQHRVLITCDAVSGPYTINIGDLVVSYSEDITFRNNPLDPPNGPYPKILATGASLNLLFEAEVAGAQANIASALSVETIALSLTTTLSGVKVTGHSLSLAGADDESDDRLKSRCGLQWSLLTEFESTDEVIQALVLAADPAVVRVAVDSTNPRGAGTFDVYIGGLDTTSGDVDVAIVLARMMTATFGGLDTVQVYKAPYVNLDASGVVYFSGGDAATVQTAVEAALLAFARTAPLGGFSFFPGPSHIISASDVNDVIRQAALAVVTGKVTVRLNTPAADVQVPVRAMTVKGTWNLVYQLVSA